MRGVRVMIVVPGVVTTALRLLIAWVNVSTTRTDPSIQDRTAFFTVVVLRQCFAMVVEAVVVVPAVAIGPFARLAAVIVGQRWVWTQVETDVTAAA